MLNHKDEISLFFLPGAKYFFKNECADEDEGQAKNHHHQRYGVNEQHDHAADYRYQEKPVHPHNSFKTWPRISLALS